MNSRTNDLNVNERVNEDSDEDDDPSPIAVKELSETNRQADEIARVRVSFGTLFSSKEIPLATFNSVITTSHINTFITTIISKFNYSSTTITINVVLITNDNCTSN